MAQETTLNDIMDVILDMKKDMNERFSNVDERLSKMDERFDNVESSINNVKLDIELRIDRNTQILAENQSVIIDKLGGIVKDTDELPHMKMQIDNLEKAFKNNPDIKAVK